MAGRLDVSNDRQHIGSELRCVRLAGHPHALQGSDRVGRAQPLCARLGGRQGRLSAFRDRFTLMFGNGCQQPEGNRGLLAAHRRHSRSTPTRERTEVLAVAN
jgi:hypothetical protein